MQAYQIHIEWSSIQLGKTFVYNTNVETGVLLTVSAIAGEENFIRIYYLIQ